MNIEYEVTNQRCKRKDKNLIVNDSQNYLEIAFSFSDDWNGCDKFVFFRCNGINYPYGVVNDKIIVPAIFLKDEWLTFGVYGINNDITITTNLCKVRLGKSFYDSETGQIDDTIYTRSIVEEIFIAINSKSDLGHTHVKSEITDFPETMPPSAHTHSKSDITDFEHNHDDRYYTETEVNEIIEQTKHDLLNRIGIICDKEILQRNETVEINALVLTNGVPLPNLKVEYYCEDA